MEKRKSPHNIRKTYGTILLDGHVRESTILETMGHTDISMTKGHYYFDRTNIEEKRAELGSVEGLQKYSKVLKGTQTKMKEMQYLSGK